MDFLPSLARRAAQSPEAPWLFYREGLDWRWRSYRRVADQVARSIAALSEGAAGNDEPIAVRPRQDPDAVVGFLAALASGCSIDLATDIGEPEWLVKCRGTLESFAAVDLPVSASADATQMPRQASMRPFLLGLSRDGAHLGAALDGPCSGLEQRPILYAGPALTTAALAALSVWSLERDAAWALEFQAEAFAATALWTRPHVLVASASELRELLPFFDKTARRRSRLLALVLAGAEEGSAEIDVVEVEERLGCPVLRWPA